jgi:hypothetical protein
VKYCVISEDKLSSEICDGGATYKSDRFLSSFMILYDGDKENLPSIKEDENLNKFFKRFDKIKEERLKIWFETHGEEPYDWMIQELELTPESEE